MADAPTSLLDAVEGVAIQGYDAERRVFYWNDASEALYGFSRAEALGRRLEDLIIPEALRDAVVQEIDRWLAGGPPPGGGEIHLKHRDGHLIEVHSNHLSLPDESGAPRLFCVDVPVVGQRSLEEALSRAPGAGAGRSHHIRTPFNAILGFSEGLAARLSSRLDGDVFTGDVVGDETSARELSRVLSQTVAALGDSLGALDPEPRTVEAQDVLVEVASVMVALYPHPDNELVLAGLLGDVRGCFDPFLIKQAVAALTRYALANSPKGSPVTLSVSKPQGFLDTVLFVIEDSGPPMADDLRLRLLSGRPLSVESEGRGRRSKNLDQLAVAQRIALATGSLLTVERTEAGTNRAGLGVHNHPIQTESGPAQPGG